MATTKQNYFRDVATGNLSKKAGAITITFILKRKRLYIQSIQERIQQRRIKRRGMEEMGK